MSSLMLSLFLSTANAGWLTDFCERHLVAQHPYQVALTKLSTSDLIREYRAQGAKRYWKAVDTDEFEMVLTIVVDRIRETQLTAMEKDMIKNALIDYPAWQVSAENLMREVR